MNGWTDIARRIGLSLMNRKPEDGNLDMAEIALPKSLTFKNERDTCQV